MEILKEAQKIAAPVALILAAGLYFGMIGAGPSTPDFLCPKDASGKPIR